MAAYGVFLLHDAGSFSRVFHDSMLNLHKVQVFEKLTTEWPQGF